MCEFYVKRFRKREAFSTGWSESSHFFVLLAIIYAIWRSVGRPSDTFLVPIFSFIDGRHRRQTFGFMCFAHCGSQWSLNYSSATVVHNENVELTGTSSIWSSLHQAFQMEPSHPASCVKLWFFIPSHKSFLWSIIIRRQSSNHLKRKRCNSVVDCKFMSPPQSVAKLAKTKFWDSIEKNDRLEFTTFTQFLILSLWLLVGVYIRQAVVIRQAAGCVFAFFVL